MDPLPDDVVARAISNSPWERLEAASRLHTAILSAVREDRTAENLALLEAAETILAAVGESHPGGARQRAANDDLEPPTHRRRQKRR
jgi:hypothetical protein